MTLTDILNALNAASVGGTFDLYGTDPDPNWPLKTLIVAANKFGPSPAVSLVSDIDTQQTAATVVLTGRATLTVPGGAAANIVQVAVTLTATLPTPETPLFQLKLAPVNVGWTFGTQFPNLPQSQQNVDGGLTWLASYLIPIQVQHPVLASDNNATTTAIGLAGTLPIAGNGVLDTLVDWIGSQPLAIVGTIEMPQATGDLPAMDLKARISGAQLKVGLMTVQDLSLWFQSLLDLDQQVYGVTALTQLSLSATMTLGGGSEAVVATLSSPLLQGDYVWPLYLGFDANKPTLSGGLLMLTGLFDGLLPSEFPLPPTLPVLDDFTFDNISVGLVPPTLAHPLGGITYVAVTLGSDKTWDPPVPFVRIRDVGTRWVLTFGGDPYAYSLDNAVIAGTVYGDVVVGGSSSRQLPRFAGLRKTSEMPVVADDGSTFTISVNALIPSYIVQGQLADDDTIPLNSALQFFFGGTGPDGPFEDVAITAFAFNADPLSHTYDARAVITTNVTVPLGEAAITLESLGFWVQVTQSAVAGGISGTFILVGGGPTGEADPTFVLAAEYSSATVNGGWTFSGALYPGMSVDLTALVAKFLSFGTPPAWVPHIYLDLLSFRFNTTSEDYRFTGRASVQWPAPVLGIAGGIAITAYADVASAGGGALTGTLGGGFQIGKVSVALETDLSADAQIYRFIATFDKLILTVTTGQRTSKGATTPHQVLYARLGGVTLGSILEYLVNLAAPTIGYTLDSPWNLLNKIDLSRFQLMFDPTDNMIELTCDVGADIVVMRIDTIGVRYWKPNGKSTVELILEGNFLGKSYTGDDALAWDVIDDPPPAVPGQGPSLLDIRYLGLGQRVSFASDVFNQLDTVRGFLNELTQQMGPVEDPDVNPLTQNPGMVYAGDSQWLIGFDITLLDTVDLGFLFNDPKLYGLSISLHGEKAKAFAGLDFEILYKKISNDVGMFRIELRLPDQFRHFEMGEVSITIGVVVIEIYTNGNFLIDMGFPYNRDFDRSFAVEVFPFLGRGGFYFGLLDGTTSRRTPKITNGTFAPVIEVGLGLAVGVGKDIKFGPLSGGAYLQVEATFQGVLGWYNPSNSNSSTDEYYWMQAVVAIHGRVYGEVDFVIVKASANIEAYAEVSVILEAYRKSIFRLSARVTVSASIKILFVRIHFSFSAQIDVSFTVGTDRRTPWILAADQSGNSLPGSRRIPSMRTSAFSRQHLLATAARHTTPEARLTATHRALTDDPAYVLTWNPDTIVFDTPVNVPICLVVSGSVWQLPAAWSGSTAPPLPATPDYRLAVVATAADGRDSASNARETTRSVNANAQAGVVSDLPLDVMMEALLRWSISAVIGSATSITSGQLAILNEQMSWSETTDAFSLDTLSTFFSKNIVMQVSGPPVDGNWPSSYSASVLPMPPFLAWTSTQLPDRDFNEFNPVGPLYEWGANAYFTQFQTSSTVADAAPDDDDPTDYESMATFVFRDWCLMLARTAVQSAEDLMTATTYSLTSPQSLSQIAKKLPIAPIVYRVRANDTVASVAAALGATQAELEFQNPDLAATLADAAPGQILDIVIGTAPGEIAADNPDQPLVPDVTVALGDVDYQLPADATFDGVASQFGLADAQALFTGTTLVDNKTVLRAGAVFTTQAASYPNPQNFVVIFAAAIFYTRFANRTNVTQGDVIAETVFQLNSGTGQPLAGWSQTMDLPVGTVLTMPPEYAGLAGAATYTTLPGDTLARIGAAVALGSGQDAADPEWSNFLDAVRAANPGWTSGATAIPALPLTGGLAGVTVALGESLTILANRTILFAAAPTGLLAWIGDQPVLAPLAVLTVPSVQFTTATTPPDTLIGLATRYGMTVADFATRTPVATNEALLYKQVSPDTPPVVLHIYHLPAQDVDALVSDVMGGTAPGQAAGLTARQLLSGQSLPAPVTNSTGHAEATGPLSQLYDLTGQQVSGPAADMTQPNAVAVALSVTVDPAYKSWVLLMETTTVQEKQTLAKLRKQYPKLDQLNPGLAVRGRFSAGLLLQTKDTLKLPIQLTNTQLDDLYPQTGLLLAPTRGPIAMPMSALSPRPYGLDHEIPVQSPDGFAFTPAGGAPLVGQWSLWPFPDALVARAQSGSDTLYELVQRYTDSSRPQTSDIVANATWATVVEFRVRRVSGYQSVFELLGADTAGRQLLLEAWQQLSAGSYGYLLYAPAPSNDDISGTMAAQPAAAATYIVKSNLSTETSSGVHAEQLEEGAPQTEDGSEYYANFGELTSFLTLLWEASVVGGYGYSFSYSDIHGNTLPESCFDQSGVATISLMLLDATQLEPAPAGRALRTTNNYALVAPGLDASTNALYVLSSDDSDDIDTPAFPPGNIGFTVTLPQADPTADPLGAQFSLVSYNVADCTDTPFTPTVPAPSMSPQEEDGTHQSLARRQRLERRIRAGVAQAAVSDGTTYWRYDQVLPLYRFGPVSVAPAVAGLPDPASDPYRGPGGAGTLVPARVQMDALDVFANVTAPSGSSTGTPPGAIDYSIGYTDPLIAVSSWPGTTLAYALGQASGKVALTVSLSSQPGALAPNPLQPATTLAAKAQLQAAKYQDIYFQLVQTDVVPSILSTLQTSAKAPVPLAVDQPHLAVRYAAANHAYAAALSVATAVPVDTTVAATLSAVWTQYGMGPYLAAAANKDVLLYQIFGAQDLTVPVGIPFVEGDTAQSITSAAQARGDGWPAPDSATALLQDTANANILLLRPQCVLALPPGSTFAVPEAAPSLADMATDMHTSVALLAGDIAAVTVDPPAFVAGFVFDYQGYSVTTDATHTTFAEVIAAFAELGVICTAADLAVENQDKPTLYAAATVLPTLFLQVGQDETLSQAAQTAFAQPLTPALTLNSLAASNVATANLFDSGALVHLGNMTIALDTNELRTVAEFAAAYGSQPGLLFSDNLTVPLPPTTTLAVPGAIAAPTTTQRAPFAIAGGDTLDGIAANFASTAEAIAEANAAMSGVLAADQQVQIQSVSVTTGTGWSIDDLWQAAQALDPAITFAQTVSAIEATTTILQGGGLFVCPPAVIPASGANLTASAAAALYNLDGVGFSQGNTGTMGLIAGGVSLTAPGLEAPITTTRYDTFNSISARFADAGVPLSITDILANNPDAALIAKGAAAFLPPPSSIFTAEMPLGAGPFPAPVFPLYVWLRIERPGAAIPLDVDPNGRVARADSPVPAPTTAQGAEGETSQTYTAFADDFVAALPLLRLATGRTENETADLWAVDFGATGITSVTVAPAITDDEGKLPRVWALRPLYNSLQTRMDVDVSTVLADGTLSPATPFNFQNVDPESWAARMLGDIDVFLSGPYAAALYADSTGRLQLKSVLDAKRMLAPAIARGLYPVLDLDMPMPSAATTEARTLVADKLSANLAGTYAMAALLQYDAAVTSAWTKNETDALPARLSGATKAMTPAPVDPRPFTLTGAKTDVTIPTSYASFLMTVPDVSVSSHVPINLGYVYDEAEFDIAAVPNVEGYVASSWVSFVPTLDEDPPSALSTDLGESDIPVPLRAYPPPPALIAQSGTASHPIPDGLDQTADWTFGVTYAHQHAEQDEVIIAFDVNVGIPPEMLSTRLTAENIVNALAGYSTAADGLWALLPGWVDKTRAAPIATLENAATSFASLITTVADAWNAHWPLTSETPGPQTGQSGDDTISSYEYYAQVGYEGIGLKTLTLTSIGTAGISPSGDWPDIYYTPPGGEPLQLTFNQLLTPTSALYDFPSGTDGLYPAQNAQTIGLAWKDLNLGQLQNAKASLAVRRNAKLLGESGPDTNEDFVYHTPDITAENSLWPLLNWPQRFAIGTGAQSGFAAALQTALTQILGTPDGQNITLAVAYGNELIPPSADDPDGVVTYLPVTLYPHTSFSATTAATLEVELEQWLDLHPPASGGGEWAVSLIFYADPPEGDAENEPGRSLLVIDKLIYRLS